ncbi:MULTISPECIES: hypothetical protein [Pseudomonas]|uniref:hypothetical protein n=1 Tax=Pseudomonas TaxID=286 RepID=UPI00070E9B02|nr:MULTISPECIES: hypothetical protein [Pseudomonas]KQW19817.1 hypothetical protein ASC85_08185 [Pseudomonas sp. Root401]PWD02004.1 hypothetical protein CX658_18795 [Pseudomonas amygdali pv. lachrymans]WHS57402.1 hypothetical protein QLH64_30765 [Pseudomonas brassicacearum]
MAEASTQSNQFNPNLPTRNITITGESSARMVQNTVRISRLEQRSIQIAMATPAVRDAGRRAMDRLQAALSALESELTQVEKEIEATNRNSSQRRAPRAERPTLSRNSQPNGDAASKATGQPSARNAQAKTRQPQKPQNNAGNGGKGGKDAQQPRQEQTQAAVKPSTASNSKPPVKEAPAPQPAPTPAPAQHKTQAQAAEQQIHSPDTSATQAANPGLQSL